MEINNYILYEKKQSSLNYLLKLDYIIKKIVGYFYLFI